MADMTTPSSPPKNRKAFWTPYRAILLVFCVVLLLGLCVLVVGLVQEKDVASRLTVPAEVHQRI